ncbi:Tetratricopeptide repeat-containing protein [Lihuaxuella thermophila]|uniref:Tetratricopeptide repeat-containing protein n=2 Tax=Lihuaxuella thermophila TaxID=1173111 RepID=A0A1H8G718_9BACL|nr:Tetratricopeptide repeat-containing protein [Lihuaxuella thermophila]
MISKIERGAYLAKRETVEKLCSFYEMDLERVSESLDIPNTDDDELDLPLQLKAIEHELWVDPDEGIEELRRFEKYTKLEDGTKSSNMAFVFFLKGKYYEKKRKWNEALAHFETAVKYAKEFSDELERTNILAVCYNGLGRVCNHENKLSRALNYIEKGIQSFNPDGLRPHVYYNLIINKASVLEKWNRDSEALKIVEDTWKEMHRIDIADARLNLYQIRVELLIKLKRFDEAIDIASEGLEKARVDHMYDRCFELWSSLGEAYANKQQLSNAQVCFQSALKLENKIRKKYLTITTYTQLGLLYLKKGKVQEAQEALKKAVLLGRNLKDDYRLVKALFAYGQFFLNGNNDLKALKCFEEALDLAKKHSLDLFVLDILLEITDICKKKDLPAYHDYMDEFQQVLKKFRKEGFGPMLPQVLPNQVSVVNDPPED